MAGDKPFLLHADGMGWIWVPVGLRDGPLPAHYEPWESPVPNPLYPGQQNNPAAIKREQPGNVYARPQDPRFPYVLTTYRLTEHHTSGAMSRVLSHLAELQPELFCEISPELAAERHLEHGAWATISTASGVIRARAMVTRRLRPLRVENRTVHQVGLPWHWGYRGLVTGDVANDLTAMSEDPNSRIMESKALLCDIAPPRSATAIGQDCMASPTDTVSPSSNQARHTYVADGRKVGFFTDPTICIGCKACEVACKEWNQVPADGQTWTGHSYDNSGSLGASTWRHVKFQELGRRLGPQVAGPMTGEAERPFGWLFLSDVCKHCGNAGCLEACPRARSCPHRSQLRLRAGRRVQRVRLLRGRLPFGDRSPARAAARRRWRVQVHVLLRPAGGWSRPPARSLPRRVDPFRTARRAARARGSVATLRRAAADAQI